MTDRVWYASDGDRRHDVGHAPDANSLEKTRMSSKIGNTLSVAIGAAVIGSLSLSQLAAASPVFQASDLAAGYMLAAAGEGKCGEGKCGVA